MKPLYVGTTARCQSYAMLSAEKHQHRFGVSDLYVITPTGFPQCTFNGTDKFTHAIVWFTICADFETCWIPSQYLAHLGDRDRAYDTIDTCASEPSPFYPVEV